MNEQALCRVSVTQLCSNARGTLALALAKWPSGAGFPPPPPPTEAFPGRR